MDRAAASVSREAGGERFRPVSGLRRDHTGPALRQRPAFEAGFGGRYDEA